MLHTYHGGIQILRWPKEVEGDQLVAELKIDNFNKLIEDQKEEINQLAIELKEALKQVQELSLRAVDNVLIFVLLAIVYEHYYVSLQLPAHLDLVAEQRG